MIYAYVVLQIVLLMLSLAGFFQVRKFLAAHNSISNAGHLDNFKSLVRGNMYVALAYIALGIPGILMSIYIGFVYGLMGIVLVLVINIPHFLFGKHLKSLEEKARQLQCSAEYSQEFRMVGETWFKKALPNF